MGFFRRKPRLPTAAETDRRPPTLQCGSCEKKAPFHLTWVEDDRCVREDHLCEAHARIALAVYNEQTRSGAGTPRDLQDEEKRFGINLIVISEIDDHQVVYLREVDGDRYFPLQIGIFEVTALDRRVKGYPSPRPLTHDAMASVIREMGGELEDVLVDRVDRQNRIYYAQSRIRQNGALTTVDMRPSDAFILAVTCQRPILLAKEVLDSLTSGNS
jgi:bifunctional DNase/RNase